MATVGPYHHGKGSRCARRAPGRALPSKHPREGGDGMETRGINEGMTVRSIDGEKLGKVVACRADEFVIEKGFFFPKDYLARYQDVADVRDGEVMLRGSSAEL